MSAQELWQEGKLDAAIKAQIAEVKAGPMDADRRYFLFALLAFSGDLERASRQLDALGLEDQQLAAGTVPYHNLLAAEVDRRRALAGETEPLLPKDAPDTLRGRVEVLRGADGARAKLDEIEAAEAAVAGTCDGASFSSISDTDDALGPTLELFAGGRWLLLPFSHVRRLTVREPRHALDLVWAPVQLEDKDDTRADVHVPVLYAGTYEQEDDGLRLGRSTTWDDRGGVTRAFGQRILFTDTGSGEDSDDRALLSVRELVLGAAG